MSLFGGNALQRFRVREITVGGDGSVAEVDADKLIRLVEPGRLIIDVGPVHALNRREVSARVAQVGHGRPAGGVNNRAEPVGAVERELVGVILIVDRKLPETLERAPANVVAVTLDALKIS